MGKTGKHSYPSTRKPYSKSRVGVGGRKKKAPPETGKSTPTYFDKLLSAKKKDISSKWSV